MQMPEWTRNILLLASAPMNKAFPLLLSLLLSVVSSAPVFAQSADPRMERLERDMQMLQKQIYGKAGSQTAGGATVNSDTGGRSEVRFTQIEERFRHMEGRMEELEFENRKLNETLERFQKDVDMRFTDSAKASPVVEPEAEKEEKPSTENKAHKEPTEDVPTETKTLKTPDKKDKGAGSGQKFESSRDHYNYAFRLLNQTQYNEAGDSFEEFINAYPKDPLIGNAYYWAGETHYVRREYIKAADLFRQGYEGMPEGPKAGDNLLKLAMSLSAMEHSSEACVVLKQVIAKFGTNSVGLKKKADAERNRLGCK